MQASRRLKHYGPATYAAWVAIYIAVLSLGVVVALAVRVPNIPKETGPVPRLLARRGDADKKFAFRKTILTPKRLSN
jgi:hypothetical protein